MPGRSIFKKTVFDNGLTLVSERQRRFRGLSIGVWVKTGTRHETRREAGMSHFLEHMLFKGTDHRSALEIAREVDEVGGEFNAFTTREYTCFHILLLDRDATLGFDILADVILNSDFDAEELERERKVILQEISMVEESPEEIAHDIYWELIYGRHGLGRPILGTESSIRRHRRGDVLRFFRKHYRPDQMTLAVSGNLTHEQIKRRIRGLSKSKWPGRESRAHHPAVHGKGFERAPALKHGRWWIPRSSEQTHLIWGVAAPRHDSPDRFAASIMNTYLGGGMSSSLFQEIREKNGLAYTVYSSLSPFTDSGVFTVYAATNHSSVPLCLRLIEECVVKLRTTLLSNEELQVIKDNIKGAVLLSSDNVESRMMTIAQSEMYLEGYVSPDEICRQIDEVTPEDLRRVARKILRPEKASVLALGPRPSRSVRAKSGPWTMR